MNATEFWSLFYGMSVTAADLAYPNAAVEHVTLEGVYAWGGAGEDTHSETLAGWAGAEVQS